MKAWILLLAILLCGCSNHKELKRELARLEACLEVGGFGVEGAARYVADIESLCKIESLNPRQLKARDEWISFSKDFIEAKLMNVLKGDAQIILRDKTKAFRESL